jgi:kynurenine 3-monooxygenase
MSANRCLFVNLRDNAGNERGLNVDANGAIAVTDGSGSLLRKTASEKSDFVQSEEPLDYGYKEFHIPPASGGGHQLEKHALHIWPRGTFMLIALPNFDGSFTCTLFLPWKGELSFESLAAPEAVAAFFDRSFADVVPLLGDVAGTFFANPTGQMVTVKCAPWNVGRRTLLLGDAAHAIVPFFGQGMNCGFEDAALLDALVDAAPHDWTSQLAEFAAHRKPDADAIADMAVGNFVEMRDKVGDARFLLEKQVEKLLLREFPDRFVSRYALVSFSRMPYRLAAEAGRAGDALLAALCDGLTQADRFDRALADRLLRERFEPIIAAARAGLSGGGAT